MTHTLRYRLSMLIGLAAIAALLVVTLRAPALPSAIPMMLGLSILILFADTYSISIGGGEVSLMPMTVTGAYLMSGTTIIGWAVLLSSLGYAAVRYRRGRLNPASHEPRGRALVEVTAMNLGMHELGILACAAVFGALGGHVPLMQVTRQAVGPLLLSGVAYLVVNHGLVTVYFATRGRTALQTYLQSLPRALLFEGAPLIWAPLIALIYTGLGLPYFVLFAFALITSSLISHSLAVTSQRLQRRLRELGGLQAVGQVLSVSLDVETILSAIYAQVTQLMPTRSFYVALYDPELGEVSFPMVIEEGKRVQGTARRARRGLTEYVLEVGEPLLIAQDVAKRAAALGLEHLGREATCWLGVPMTAGDEVLGMMAVQSFEAPEELDRSHLEILETIAAQAAIAVKNARLYERTDEALARRVQELDSVLRTTHDGVILLDLELRVLAVNRALADLVGIAQTDLARHPIDALQPGGDPLIARIGYELDGLRDDCAHLLKGDVEQIEAVIVLGPTSLHVNRTLTPVRDGEGSITGWLLNFRDLTEELELKHLREDLTGMLVHDLRSPMSLVLASLSMLPEAITRREQEQVDRLVAIAQRSGERILTLIDDLLDISQLERGQLPMSIESTSIEELFREVTARYLPMASANDIVLAVDAGDALPPVGVDGSLILRVLSNLVDNALKFTPNGGEVKLCAREDARTAPGAVIVSVCDTGPGIPYDARPKLFEKFQQVPNIHGRRRGTGLGLPFCKLTVEAHGGQIWVDSEVGQGSTFSLTLPIVAPPLLSGASIADRRSGAGEEASRA